MEHLPDELLLHIISYLTAKDLLSVRLLTRRFSRLGRDDAIWKQKCFDQSRYESNRRRQALLAAYEPNVAALRRVVSMSSVPLLARNLEASLEAQESREGSDGKAKDSATIRAMACWEPAYPSERADYYQEYIHRHAPCALNWLETPWDTATGHSQIQESVGMAVLESAQGLAEKAIAPLEDGSLCIWDISSEAVTSQKRGTIVGRSQPSLLFKSFAKASTSIINNSETGAVENVSIDRTGKQAFVAVLQDLHQVDLNTLQTIKTQHFPFPITALSSTHPTCPMTVGTNMTLHLYDARSPPPGISSRTFTRCELIGGSPPRDSLIPLPASTEPVSLSQPGPLSILHLPNDGSPHSVTDPIWVAGRFTSLLEYDRRFWPRISSTIFSGARLSSLNYLPFPYVPRPLLDVDASLASLHTAKSAQGSTLIAAGQYKGKGSLELYGLPRENAREGACQEYRNRQTASRSRLLSVAPHGMRLVFADGDGNLKWVERDGSSIVRTFNINEYTPPPPRSTPEQLNSRKPSPTRNSPSGNTEENGDIVQKIVSTDPRNTGAAGIQNDLLIWTGDGRIGLVGFGHDRLEFHDNRDRGGDEREEEIEQGERYARKMRGLLERQADETRILRRFGMAYDGP